MLKKDRKFSRAVELPICPFCDGKVYYTSWVTHNIFQIECEICGAHWRTVLKESSQEGFYIELTKSKSDGTGRELLNLKLSLDSWMDMIRERIHFD